MNNDVHWLRFYKMLISVSELVMCGQDIDVIKLWERNVFTSMYQSFCSQGAVHLSMNLGIGCVSLHALR